MYLDYWQLDAKPFESNRDAKFLYSSDGRQSAMHKLRYAIEGARAAALLAGQSGVGKTLLVHSLREQLAPQFTPFVHVVFPQMSGRDLLVYLAEQLGAPPAAPPRHTIEESLRRLEYMLGENAKQERHAVVVVDEAHLLEDTDLLEPLRLLLNLTNSGEPTFTLLLVGQLPVLPMIERYGALDERLDLKCLLPALTLDETASYIHHRLSAAGATRDIFSPEAMVEVHALSGGVPRRINRACDLALLVGFANEQHAIDAEQVRAVHDELVAVTPLAG